MTETDVTDAPELAVGDTGPAAAEDQPEPSANAALEDRLAAVGAVLAASRGRVAAEVLDRAEATRSRASTRLQLSDDHTVVALAGATGSGKSSTFNALTEMELSAVGVRRPTTSWTMACVWGRQGADPLLDFVGIAERHRVSHDSLLDDPARSRELQGLVLLDLPDHDSTQTAHHAEVDRVVAVADLLVWVLDPQKYADQAIHSRYLRRLNAHKDIMLVVLNHIDEVKPRKVAAMVEDLQRLLVEDGLEGVSVLTTSAKFGQGIPELRAAIAERVHGGGASADRVAADLTALIGDLTGLLDGEPVPTVVGAEAEAQLVEAIAEAAGVPTAVRFVENRDRAKADLYFRWPLLPARRLDSGVDRSVAAALGSTSAEVAALAEETPNASAVERGRVNRAVRECADDVAARLPSAWAHSVQDVATEDLDLFNDELDAVMETADVGGLAIPMSWKLARVLKWLTVFGLLGGLTWLVVSILQEAAIVGPVTVMIASVLLGLLLTWRGRSAGDWAAGQHAGATRQRLYGVLGEVTRERVTQPIQAELDALIQAREGLARARQA